MIFSFGFQLDHISKLLLRIAQFPKRKYSIKHQGKILPGFCHEKVYDENTDSKGNHAGNNRTYRPIQGNEEIIEQYTH
jgi:hypothetical protein